MLFDYGRQIVMANRKHNCSTARLLNRYIAILSKKCFYHGVQPVVHGDSTVQLLYGLENSLRPTSTTCPTTSFRRALSVTSGYHAERSRSMTGVLLMIYDKYDQEPQ